MGGANVDNSPKNLIALCRKCHDFAHEGKFSREFLFENNGFAENIIKRMVCGKTLDTAEKS